MPNPCELCHQQMLELLPPRDASTHSVEAHTASETLRADEELQRKMQAHLAACPDCAREWTRLQNMTQALHSIPMASAPVDLRARIRSQIVDERTAQEQKSTKNFWQRLTFRPQRVAWAGSVVVGGFLFVLATQQPIEFYSSNDAPSALLQQDSAIKQRESSLRLEQKSATKTAPKAVIGKHGATKNSKSRTLATTPNAASGRTNMPGAINRAANNPASADDVSDANTAASASPNLRPAPPAMIPAVPVLPPSELRPVAPPTTTPPTTRQHNQALRPSIQQSAPPKTSTRRDASTQKSNHSTRIAPRNAMPELFSDSGAATKTPSPKAPPKLSQLKKPSRSGDSRFSDGAPPTAKSAPEPMMTAPAARAETREGTQDANLESEPNTASSPSTITPNAGAPAATRESTRTRAGMSAMRSSSAGSSAAGSAPSVADSSQENLATHNEADATSQQRVVVISTRFISSRDVKTARLRVALPSGATLASPSTQDLVVWQGRARAGIAIPIDISVRIDSSSDSLRLVLEEKRGSSWRSVQERTIALEP